MSEKAVTRRSFLSAAAVIGAAVSVGCPRQQPPETKGVKVFKRSGRKIHVSNAAKSHNANRLYKTRLAALGDKPHKGDDSYVVELIINRTTFNKLFANGRQIADLRHNL